MPKTPMPGFTRAIVTTYYAYGPGDNVVVKKTRSKWADMATRNAFYKLTQNEYAADIVEIVDEESHNELHCVLLRSITTGDVSTAFKRDPKRPTLLTNIPKEALK